MAIWRYNDAHDLLRVAIASYQRKHNGRSPKRIFVSLEFRRELANSCGVLFHDDPTVRATFYGIPFYTYCGDGENFYLSDEEELF